MADQQQIPSAPFPAPPPFWKHFTSENLARLQAIRDNKDEAPQSLPHELKYLEPPTPPTEIYTTFGEEQTLSTALPTLSSRGVEQLYPSSPNIDHSAYLLRVVRSLHLNFQELSMTLSANPALKDEKLADIKNLFQNAHWLINMYRPHQARETLIAMMEDQVEEAKAEIEECDRLKRKVEGVMAGFEEEGLKNGEVEVTGGQDAESPGRPVDGGEKDRKLLQMMANIDVGLD